MSLAAKHDFTGPHLGLLLGMLHENLEGEESSTTPTAMWRKTSEHAAPAMSRHTQASTGGPQSCVSHILVIRVVANSCLVPA